MNKSTTLTIEAGLGHTFQFDVEQDCVIVYWFDCSDAIYFSVTYDDNKQNRLMTWTKDGKGALLCVKKGKVLLEFDNSKSWLRGVTLTAQIDVEFPLESGLEKPISFQLSPLAKFHPDLEKRLLRISSPPQLTTRQILQSGRRLLAYENSVDCQNLTGRMVDFSLGKAATDADLLACLNQDLRPYLNGKTHNKTPPKAVLGTMTFDAVDEATSAAIVKLFANFSESCDEVDTAFAYGKSEEVLGKILVPVFPKMIIATKVNPWPHSGKSFSLKDMRSQIQTSFKNLGVKKVNILYLHQPDNNTSLEVTLEAIDKFYKEGLFQEFGLSNFAAWQVVLVFHMCRERGWILPTVYQGMYNILTRDVEPELFPALRAHNIRFYAYNPLAGGLLTGRYNAIENIPKYGRFARNTTIGKRYLERFWVPSYFDAMKQLNDVCKETDISITDVAFRWLAYHSLLDTTRGDAVILGGTSASHMTTNLSSLLNGRPLPQVILNTADKAWELCRSDCPPYFRK